MRNKTVAILGLGYVGLPLALAFGRVMNTIGFDISVEKVNSYRKGYDPNGTMSDEMFVNANYLTFTVEEEDLQEADYAIISVPTPVDSARRPDLSFVIEATETVGRNLKKGCIVIFESTVYPGVTENICKPILERESKLKSSVDGFLIGYSPERINPGDNVHTLEKIIKVVSGQDAYTLDKVASLYEKVIEAGVYRAPSIKVAEAAKVIENVQRDLNIALMNELAIIFNKMNIDTCDVLETAKSKWNFMPFSPGLVGGHCIGIDPYYLTYKAEELGYHPQVILAGRRINDEMGKFIAEQTVKQMISADRTVKGGRVALLGLSFKENCEDIRNSRVIDLIDELESYGINVLVCDPVANKKEAKKEYGIDLKDFKDLENIDAVVAAVAHKELLSIKTEQFLRMGRQGMPFLDVKSLYDQSALTKAGLTVWRL